MLLAAAAIIWSSLSTFCDSFPTSLAIPCSRPLTCLLWMEGEEEGKGEFWYSLPGSYKKTQWTSQQEVRSSFRSHFFFACLFLCPGKEICLKQWPMGHWLSSIKIFILMQQLLWFSQHNGTCTEAHKGTLELYVRHKVKYPIVCLFFPCENWMDELS